MNSPYKCFVLIPNLERREDRWLVSVGAHRAAGWDNTHIVRFLAHDGADYNNIAEIHHAAIERGSETPYLDPTMFEDDSSSLCNFCWRWTYYEILEFIAEYQTSNEYWLIAIDDFCLMYRYNEILEHINILNQADNPLRLIQYFVSDMGDYKPRLTGLSPVRELPAFQHGIGGMGDYSLLCSPNGAAFILDYMDAHPGAPETLMWSLAHDNTVSKRGCYSHIDTFISRLENAWVANIQDRHGGRYSATIRTRNEPRPAVEPRFVTKREDRRVYMRWA